MWQETFLKSFVVIVWIVVGMLIYEHRKISKVPIVQERVPEKELVHSEKFMWEITKFTVGVIVGIVFVGWILSFFR